MSVCIYRAPTYTSGKLLFRRSQRRYAPDVASSQSCPSLRVEIRFYEQIKSVPLSLYMYTFLSLLGSTFIFLAMTEINIRLRREAIKYSFTFF